MIEPMSPSGWNILEISARIALLVMMFENTFTNTENILYRIPQYE
jgi:hypothetical protein